MLFINWDIDPSIFSIGSFQLKYYSLCWVLAFASSYLVMRSIFKKEGLKPELLDSLTIYVFLGTFIGARLGHCLFYDPGYYFSHPLEIILPFARDASGQWVFTGYAGLASHGGTIGIIISLILFCRKKKMPLLDITDKLGVVAPLAAFFIRIGNFFNSEIIGKPTDMPWAIIFPTIDVLPRHPSQLYEAASYLIIFLIAYLAYAKRRNRYAAGFIFGLSIVLIFTARFLIEYTKEVQEPFEVAMKQSTGMNMGQLLSIPFIIAGVILVSIKYKKR